MALHQKGKHYRLFCSSLHTWCPVADWISCRWRHCRIASYPGTRWRHYALDPVNSGLLLLLLLLLRPVSTRTISLPHWLIRPQPAPGPGKSGLSATLARVWFCQTIGKHWVCEGERENENIIHCEIKISCLMGKRDSVWTDETKRERNKRKNTT